MALYQLASFPVSTSIRLPSTSYTSLGLSRNSSSLGLSRNSCFPGQVRCMVTTSKPSDQTIVRRSGNYQPSIWDNNFIQSLKSNYVGKPYTERIDQLKGEVRLLLEKAENHLHQLEIIDTLQRLGLAYHFEDEIDRALKGIFNDNHCGDAKINDDLYATSLEFRLLRQHGYNVHQETFKHFMDQQGNFKACLCEDLEGILYLYEASYLMVEGESILEDARDFTSKILQKYVKQHKDAGYLSLLVSHALELPLHWRMQRLEAVWFINAYEKKQDMKPTLLELAKLDFNVVQAIHMEDLKQTSLWWTHTGLSEKLEFARDRLVENFLWALGVTFEPQFGFCRRNLTKVNSLVLVIDDIYDVYGTLDELELFTDAVVRWDINAMDQLPDYMKTCFLALYNSTNEVAFDILIDQGFHVINYLKKAWADLCKSYLVEAKWYYGKQTPTLQEYLDNAWTSISGPLVLVYTYFSITNPITNEALQFLEEYPDIVRWSSIIERLSDDLGTSSDELKRGDVPKSIQCYMNEIGALEDEAREHIRYLISQTWNKINQDRMTNSLFSKTFTEMAMNLIRTAHSQYLHGDGVGARYDLETKDQVISLLIQPISQEYLEK